MSYCEVGGLRFLIPDKDGSGAEGDGGCVRGLCACVLYITMHLYPSGYIFLCLTSVLSIKTAHKQTQNLCYTQIVYSINCVENLYFQNKCY